MLRLPECAMSQQEDGDEKSDADQDG